MHGPVTCSAVLESNSGFSQSSETTYLHGQEFIHIGKMQTLSQTCKMQKNIYKTQGVYFEIFHSSTAIWTPLQVFAGTGLLFECGRVFVAVALGWILADVSNN